MININPVIYPFSCESPTKPETKGKAAELAISPASYGLKRRQGFGYVYAITARTPEKQKPPGLKTRKVLELTSSDFNGISKLSDLQKIIEAKQSKLPPNPRRAYIGLTKNSPGKRIRAHGRSARKKSKLKVHSTMRSAGLKGKKIEATVVASAPLDKLGAVEEAFRLNIVANKENTCLNMRKGGAGGGGHKL